jgi:hypothetical protein
MVQSAKSDDLIDKVISLFDKNKIVGEKYLDYLDFIKVV